MKTWQELQLTLANLHWVKSVQIRIFFFFLPHSDWISREYLSEYSPNTEKYGPEKTPHLDTFHAVLKSRKGQGDY